MVTVTVSARYVISKILFALSALFFVLVLFHIPLGIASVEALGWLFLALGLLVA